MRVKLSSKCTVYSSLNRRWNYRTIEFFGWDYCDKEMIDELVFPKEVDYEFPKVVIEEVNIVTDARKFKYLDLQTKGNKKIKPSTEEQP